MSKKLSKNGSKNLTPKSLNPQPASQSQSKILVAFLLNLSFSIFEFFGGMLTNSVAITSDAIHDFGDALSIGVAYFLERYSKKSPDQKYTYGYIRYSVMGGLITTLILITGSAIVLYESFQRLTNPIEVNYNGMIILAIFGVAVNFAAVYFTRDKSSLNQKSINLHMLEDVLGWAIVLVGAIIMHFTNFNFIDPLLSIGVAIFILISALRNFKEILDLFLEKTPAGVSLDELKSHLLKIKNVADVHHIHVWSLDGYTNYATLHVVCKTPFSDSKTYSQAIIELKDSIRAELRKHNISHTTIELESFDEPCPAKTCHVEHHSETAHAHHHH